MRPLYAKYRMPEGHDPQWEHVTVLEWGNATANAAMNKVLVVFPDGKLLWAEMDRIRLTVDKVEVPEKPLTEHVTRYPR